MRIDRIELHNFKKYAGAEFQFHPNITLLVGENGSGKTTVLDALAVSLGLWLVTAPDSELINSRRGIKKSEIRIEATRSGDRVQFRECRPVRVTAFGQIDNTPLSWTRQLTEAGKITNNSEAKEALSVIADVFERDRNGEQVICPVLVYYGAGRAWLPSNDLNKGKAPGGPARRWAAFYDCFDERIRFAALMDWFRRETIEMGNRGGQARPGFEAVRGAIVRCVPGAEGVFFDGDREEVVLTIDGNDQPFGNLSAGQRMMFALVADIAIKAVTQNAHLLPADALESEEAPAVLTQTPGVVLIDELDVHLHPKWQRRVIEDLRQTFPLIQFICTSHSPFVIQSLRSGEELLMLEGQPTAQVANRPIEEIAQGIMGVQNPQVSLRYAEMEAVAKSYLETLDEAAKAPEKKLAEYLNRLAESIGPYADNPAFQAFLEMNRAAKLGV